MRPINTPQRTLVLVASLVAVAAAAIVVALFTGSVRVASSDVADALLGAGTSEGATVVRELRLPRALAAFGVGGLLALAGALMQVLLRNPLADPYVLGISGGASVGALGAIALGAPALVAPASFAGALLSTLLVFALSRSAPDRSPWTSTRLLLTGVVVAAGWSALVALLLSLAPAAQIKGMVYWLLGDLAGAQGIAPVLATLAIVLVASLALARDLNALSRGVHEAAALGVAVPVVALAVYALASLATATAVTAAGSIGFVGLIVPHALRLVLGNDQRALLPACALAGGALLVLADTAARTVAAPLQLPVGVLTALLGVPTFLWLLSRTR